MSRERGAVYENQACCYLESLGFKIIERNYFCKMGEIDIIARKEGAIRFIEVKGSERGEAEYRITPAKLAKLERTIRHYLQVKRVSDSYQLDAVIISGGRAELLENITW